MQIAKISKAKAAAVIVIVLLMASVTLMAMPVSLAQEPTNPQDIYSLPLPSGVTPDFTQPTICHLSFTPDPIGVGQPLLVNMWVAPNLHGVRAFHEYDIVFTKPDGTKDTVKIPSYIGDATSFLNYVVDQVGTWQIQFDFPGGYFPAGNYTAPIGTFVGTGNIVEFEESCYYSPSSDGPYNFTVQSEMVYSWPAAPLPTDYWTRPVNLMNREWKAILGWYPATGVYGGNDPNWPADTNTYMSNYDFIPYVQGPNSAHILRKRLDQYASGIIGGPPAFSKAQYAVTSSGNTPSLVFSGNCYDSKTVYYDGVPTSVLQCNDLRTGEVYWEQTGISTPSWIVTQDPGPPDIYAYATQSSGEGAFLANIQSGRMIYRNPSTGGITMNISISPLTSGFLYKCADWPYWLTVQNLGSSVPVDQRYRLINWTIYGTVTRSVTYSNPELRVLNNVSWPFSSLPSNVDYEAGYAVNYESIYNDATGIAVNQRILVASLKTGAIVQNFTTDVGTHHFQSASSFCVDHGRVAVDFTDGRVHCWDCATGKKLWVSEIASWPWATFYEYGVSSYGGNILIGTYAGYVALDWDTGKVSYIYRSQVPANFESPYQGHNPFFTSCTIADGKVYAYSSEHTPSQPIPRSWGIHCFNATTGEEIWALMAGGRPGAIADGYLTYAGSDGYMYVFGKGKSAATVTAPDVSVPLGTAFMIKGTVLDMSPAQPGTPCVSKESMSNQMLYLHMQQPIGGIWNNETMIGVPVSLDAVDPNGNTIHIADVTTDGYSGTFGYTWTPDIEGQYSVTATFIGDESYGCSFAQTYVSVGPEQEPYPTPTEPKEPADNTSLLYGILVAVIVAIIAAIAAVLLVLRKR